MVTGETGEVSVALERLLTLEVAACVGVEKLAMPDDFRRQHAYTAEVCAELGRKQGWLRRCFDVAAGLRTPMLVGAVRALTLEQWLELLQRLDLLTGVDVGEAEAVLCFSWSRMCCTDSATLRGRHREVTLPFEGFIEALCRLAALKALPSDLQIVRSGMVDAGWYLGDMREKQPSQYDSFLRANARTWGSSAPMSQPMARCIAHLLELMSHTARRRDIQALADVKA